MAISSLVQFDGPTPGYFERTEDADWEPFMPFQSIPAMDWQNPNLRFVDLTGDGFRRRADQRGQSTSGGTTRLSTDGFGPAQRVPQVVGRGERARNSSSPTGPSRSFSPTCPVTG